MPSANTTIADFIVSLELMYLDWKDEAEDRSRAYR